MTSHCQLKMVTSIYFFVFIIGLVSAQGPNPRVNLLHGEIEGSWKLSTKGRFYANFQGIPYAQPPVGIYRFEEPQHLQPWNGVWNATSAPSACLQYDPIDVTISGSEDCLFLHVYTPRLQPGAMLPVMVYIHGGAFMYGDGAVYGAANLMDWDIVIVTLNYRLGAFGFLSTGDDVVPGNNGLKDQLFALRWVNDHIELFGGNPKSITLAGESAGGVSVHYHFLSPMSRGLFVRGLSYSGSAFSSWALDVNPIPKSKLLGSKVGCPTSSSRKMIDCLKSKPERDIINAQIEMFDWRIHLYSPFNPVVEGPSVRGAFIPLCPYEATKAGLMARAPLILTDTSEEGLYPAAAFQSDPSILPELEANWDQLAVNIFQYNDTIPLNRRSEVAQRIKQEYLGGQPVSQATFPQLVRALGDRLFYGDVGKLAQIHAEHSRQPTYVLIYGYRGTFSLSNVLAHNNVNYGVSHGDDVLRIFSMPGLSTSEPTERAMVEQLINIIYSYSVYGTPNLSNSSTVWLPVKPYSRELHYLDIQSPYRSQMKSTTNFGNKYFWDQLGFDDTCCKLNCCKIMKIFRPPFLCFVR